MVLLPYPVFPSAATRVFSLACDQQELLIRTSKQHVNNYCWFNEMTPSLCRAARALLGMNQTELARAAELGLSTVVDFERERRHVSLEAIDSMRAVFERAGIEFIEENGGGVGVRYRKPRHSRRK
jgi:DNA-binding XRE family transcriptional regulator